MAEIVRFETNVPIEAALNFSGPGLPVAGRYSDYVLFTLNGDRKMYLTPQAAARLDQLRLQPGEPFQICKREVKNGNRKSINWHIERVDPEPGSPLAQELQESIDAIKARKASEEASRQPANADKHAAAASASTGGPMSKPAVSNGHGSQSPAPPTQLEWSLKTALTAASNAEKHAEQIGYACRFRPEDIRAMAISVLIGLDKEAGRR